MEYPPAREFRAAVRCLAASHGNVFTVGQCLAHATSGPISTCCVVRALPPARADGADAFYFGRDADGYIVITPRGTRGSSRRAWPLTPCGMPAPVRLHRWVGGVRAGLHALHACDNAWCIARAHISSGTPRDNLRDQHERDRRRTRRVAVPAARRDLQTSSPPRPLVRLGAAKEAREARFCVTGFDSPAKRARALRRAAAAAAEPIDFVIEASELPATVRTLPRTPACVARPHACSRLLPLRYCVFLGRPRVLLRRGANQRTSLAPQGR